MATAQVPRETSAAGAFVRQPNRFTDRITADGSSGYPAEAGRYALYACLACPWAHRSIIVRRLLGLTDAIALVLVDPIRDERGWAFGPDFPDHVNGWRFLSEGYLATDPGYDGRVTVPAVWDAVTGRMVTNDYPEITVQLETQFTALHAPGAPDLYPEHLRAGIDAVNADVFRDVNNGVYRAGFAATQAAYEEAFDALFARLAALDERLAGQRFLVGDRLTEADVRLYTTLARFDAVYHGHFKCNLRRLVDHEHLWAYARDLHQRPGFGDTTDLDQIKRHYYATHGQLNPSRIVPKGPAQDWSAPHGRDRLPEVA